MIVHFATKENSHQISLEGDEYRHCVKTLRHKVGDDIKAFDQDGHLYDAKILTISKTTILATILKSEAYAAKPSKLAIALAPTKAADRVELAVSKAVEIGIDTIYLVNTFHAERSRYKSDRLLRIILSAAKQSLNFKLPELITLNKFEDIFTHASSYNNRYIGHCHYEEPHLLTFEANSADHTLMLIGPEGDFTLQEVNLAKQNEFIGVGLGYTRLRTETAALVSLSILRAKIDTAP